MTNQLFRSLFFYYVYLILICRADWNYNMTFYFTKNLTIPKGSFYETNFQLVQASKENNDKSLLEN